MRAHLFLALCAITGQSDVPVAAIKTSSIPLKTVVAGKGLEDMQLLKTTLKDVQIVGMGEPTHGSREVFQMKHRMFEFLVQEMGYTIFAIEASMPDCVAMDRYVTTGEGNVEDAVEAQGFWTWSTEEVADLIRWMRKYNMDPAHKTKLRVVGVDMQNRYGADQFLQAQLAKVGVKSDTAKMEQAVAAALPKIREKFGDEQAELVKQIGVVFQQATMNEKGLAVMQVRTKVFPYLVETVLLAPNLLKNHTDLTGDALLGMQVLEKSSKTIYSPTQEEQQNMLAYAKAVREYAKQAKKDKQDLDRSADLLEYFGLSYKHMDVVGKNYRDMCMAQNLEWTVKTYLPGQKAMLWAHNMHISRWEQSKDYRWMGAYLDDVFKAKYYPVGFSFYEGSFQAMDAKMAGVKEWTVKPAPAGSLDATLNMAGPKPFFLDFGSLDEKARGWFQQPRKSRSIGALYNPEYEQAYLLDIAPAKLFSGMIFIAKTTRARPL